MKIILALLFLCPLSLCAQIVSKADIKATEAHREALVLQLASEEDAAVQTVKETQAQLDVEKAAHAKSDAALTANVAVNADLNKQISGLNSQIGALERRDLWDRWKFSFVGLFIGVAVAIVTAYLAKIGLLGATAGEKIAEFAAKA